MENKARFDLNNALLAWKQQLANQPGISVEAVRELETHLLEAFSAFKHGLTDEQAFRAACRQMGSAKAIAKEFAKASPLQVWKERVFWIVLAGLCMSVWSSISTAVLFPLMKAWETHKAPYLTVGISMSVLPVIAMILVARGGAETLFHKLGWTLRNRWLFASLSFALILALAILNNWFLYKFPPSWANGKMMPPLRLIFAAKILWPTALIALLAWVFPRQKDILLSKTVAPQIRLTIWRDRIFWVALGMLVHNCWNKMALGLYNLILPEITGSRAVEHDQLLTFGLQFLVISIPLILLAIMTARGSLRTLGWYPAKLFSSRWRIAVSGFTVVLLCHGFIHNHYVRTWDAILSFFALSTWPIILVAFITWLKPTNESRSEVLA